MDISAANSVGGVGCLFVHIWRQKDEMYSVCFFALPASSVLYSVALYLFYTHSYDAE